MQSQDNVIDAPDSFCVDERESQVFTGFVETENPELPIVEELREILQTNPSFGCVGADDTDNVDDVEFNDLKYESGSDFSTDEESDEERVDDENIFDDLPNANNDSSNSETDRDKEPLFPGATISLGAFMLLMAAYFNKHNITGDGIQQLLNIIALALPQGHLLCTSLHAYKAFFKSLKNPLVHHFYCKYCLSYVSDITTERLCKLCSKPFHKKDKNYFVEIPVDNQLRNLFLQDGFYELLQKRFERDISPGKYEDIYDGRLYKSYLGDQGLLNTPNNVSFTFNTDGAAVFKSSNFSIWPIYLIINELPYSMRIRKENMIMAALWFGNQKPSMATFLKPFLDAMNKLYEGISCFAPSIGNFICKGFLLCGTADLPARSMLCNSTQYNGAFSCWKCKQRGGTAKVGKGHTHVFPYDSHDPKGPGRTLLSICEDAKAAVRNKEHNLTSPAVNGIKGPSWLVFFPKFNLAYGIAIDYMHGVLLGIQKLLLRLWFSQEFSSESFSFSARVCEVDQNLEKLTPTLDISRLPRSISNELKYWKASEYRSFLLYYGATVLLGILDNERFAHYILLVNAIHLLLKCGSDEADICRADEMLLSFCENFSRLYKESFMTLNIHQLVHLADSVRYLGPLYTHSCFSFEDNNGFILKMIRGTQCIDNQITTGISFIQKLPELKQKCLTKGSKEDELYNSIQSPHILKRREKIKDGIFILGGVKERALEEKEFRALTAYLNQLPTTESFRSYKRLEINEMIVYGSSYRRMTKRDNSAICYKHHDNKRFGRVRSFLQVNENDCQLNVAIVEKLHVPVYDERSSILSVKITDELDIVLVSDILRNVLFTCFDTVEEKGYVCLFPNNLESD